MRPLWYPNRRQRFFQALKTIGAWALCCALFGGIGALLAWRG